MWSTFVRLMTFATGIATTGTGLLILWWFVDGTTPTQMPVTLTATIASSVMLVTGFVFWLVVRRL